MRDILKSCSGQFGVSSWNLVSLAMFIPPYLKSHPLWKWVLNIPLGDELLLHQPCTCLSLLTRRGAITAEKRCFMIVLWHAACVSLRLHRVAPQEALAVQQPFSKALKPTTIFLTMNLRSHTVGLCVNSWEMSGLWPPQMWIDILTEGISCSC